MHAHLRFIPRNELCFRGWNGVEGEGGGKLWPPRGELPPAAEGKQKLLPKIPGVAGKEGETAIKGDRKFGATFSECSCVKKVRRASKSKGFVVYISAVNSIGKRGNQARFSKRKQSCP